MIIERQSIVDAPTERVWARVVTPEGINDELRPWLTMSMPRGAKDLTVVANNSGDLFCIEVASGDVPRSA